jgi:putative membrane protein
MKAAAGLALILGLMLFAGLTLYEGAGEVARAFTTVGFGVLWIAALRLAQTGLSGFAWEALIAPPRPSLWTFCKLRWVRESINSLLPVAQVGGDVFGARLLHKSGVSGGVAAASVIVDVLAMTATQVVFTLIGVVLLLRSGAKPDLSLSLFFAALLMAPALAGFWLAPRLLAMGWMDRLAEKVENQTGWAAIAGLPALREGLDSILRRRAGLAAALGWHMFIWFFGVLESWLILQMLGEPRSFAVAVTIESLGHAVKAAGVIVPGAWGVQEGGYIALCAAFGIGSPSAIALSLVKRIPDFVCGLPGLWLWRRMERQGAPSGTKLNSDGRRATLLGSAAAIGVAGIVTGVALSPASFLPSAAQAESADDAVALVKGLQDGQIDVVRRAAQLSLRQRFDQLRPPIGAAFDLPAMAHTCYGPGWDELSDSQRSEWTEAFGDYVAASYAARMEGLNVTGFERDAQLATRGDASVVTSRMTLAEGGSAPIDYVLRQTPKGWRIADILANGSISELAQWRRSLRSLAPNGDFSANLAALRQRQDSFLTP